MKGLWQMWEGILPKEVCEEIMLAGSGIQKSEATVDSSGVVDKVQRRSMIGWITQDNEDFSDVWKFIERKFHEANSAAFGVDITFMKNIQYTTYDENDVGHYDWHEDIFWESNFIYDRKLSMVVQLSDPDTYSGCDLELQVPEAPNSQSLRKQGTIIVFPSFVKHRITPIMSGHRESLVSWVEGPLWR